MNSLETNYNQYNASRNISKYKLKKIDSFYKNRGKGKYGMKEFRVCANTKSAHPPARPPSRHSLSL